VILFHHGITETRPASCYCSPINHSLHCVGWMYNSLQREPAQRKSAEQLLAHPFLTKDYKTTKAEMASWVQNAVKVGKEMEAKALASGTPITKGGKTTTTTAAATGGRAPLATSMAGLSIRSTTTTTTPGTPVTPLAPGNTTDGRIFAGQLHTTNPSPPVKR
jgi:hypothetical protein